MANQRNVFIYALSTCGHCRATKSLLNENNIEYDFIDVDLLQGDGRKSTLEEMKKYNPALSFPTILIGDKVIVGFVEDEIREVLGL